jgi:hypothetical protein
MMRCNGCYRKMKGAGAMDGACACGGLIEAARAGFPRIVPSWDSDTRAAAKYAVDLELKGDAFLNRQERTWLNMRRQIARERAI